MFFENHPLNEMDTKYNKLTSAEKKACTGIMYYINSQNMSEGMEARFDIYINNIF
jgi:hypothetical protein